ncbi:MAG: ribbon-helix-helix domain-containing protein [Promethearchaeota archaeon]
MKIVTVNVPENYIEAINKLVGEKGIYPSRSELIRCAVRDFLMKELKQAVEISNVNENHIEKLDEEKYVRIPYDIVNENSEPIRLFKTYKIVRRLEH